MKWRNLSSPARSIEFFLSDRSSSGCEIDRVLRDRPSSARSIEFCEIDRVLRHRSSYARSTALRVNGPGFNPRYVRFTFFSRLMFFLLSFYQLYLVQHSLLFNFADWQCVAGRI